MGKEEFTVKYIQNV